MKFSIQPITVTVLSPSANLPLSLKYSQTLMIGVSNNPLQVVVKHFFNLRNDRNKEIKRRK
nr:hypothetical protein [Bacteroidota bacterium]